MKKLFTLIMLTVSLFATLPAVHAQTMFDPDKAYGVNHKKWPLNDKALVIQALIRLDPRFMGNDPRQYSNLKNSSGQMRTSAANCIADNLESHFSDAKLKRLLAKDNDTLQSAVTDASVGYVCGD